MFFDFETPKKFKKESFLNLYIKEKDSETKSINYSKRKNELLDFIGSSDEEELASELSENNFFNNKENIVWENNQIQF